MTEKEFKEEVKDLLDDMTLLDPYLDRELYPRFLEEAYQRLEYLFENTRRVRTEKYLPPQCSHRNRHGSNKSAFDDTATI